jgi:hypothetical protein
MALLWVDIAEIACGVKSASSLAVAMGDGARYRMPFWAV